MIRSSQLNSTARDRSFRVRLSSAFGLLLFLVVLLVVTAPNVAAQARSVRGTVTDRSGEPLRGAVVKIKDTLTLHIRSYITQADGQYRFYGLNPDLDYELKAKHRGHTSRVKTLNWYDSRIDAQIDFKLRLKDDARESSKAALPDSKGTLQRTSNYLREVCQ